MSGVIVRNFFWNRFELVLIMASGKTSSLGGAHELLVLVRVLANDSLSLMNDV
jgi:hypothetical protein